MQELIDMINQRIAIEKVPHMTKVQESYVTGLCDALQIVENFFKLHYVIGNWYYVIMPDEETGTRIDKMRLYRINEKNKTSYCFSKDKSSSRPDLILYNRKSLNLRVHNTREEAEQYRDFALKRF